MTDERTKPVPLWRRFEYPLSLLVVAFGAIGVVDLAWGPRSAADPHLLVKPMLVLIGLTFAVLLSMAAIRHWAALTNRMSIKYARDLRSEPPAEWIERPARTYNNLLQGPTLFYVVSLLMIATPWADAAQIRLAWLYVASRVAHAVIYLAINRVPPRFAAFAISSFALMALWARFAVYATLE